MADLKHGGPAFPQAQCPQCGSGHESHTVEDKGMSLRDYFAAHAPILDKKSFEQGDSSLRIDAARAWRWADALLAERER